MAAFAFWQFCYIYHIWGTQRKINQMDSFFVTSTLWFLLNDQDVKSVGNITKWARPPWTPLLALRAPLWVHPQWRAYISCCLKRGEMERMCSEASCMIDSHLYFLLFINDHHCLLDVPPILAKIGWVLQILLGEQSHRVLLWGKAQETATVFRRLIANYFPLSSPNIWVQKTN